eukprot:418149_1
MRAFSQVVFLTLAAVSPMAADSIETPKPTITKGRKKPKPAMKPALGQPTRFPDPPKKTQRNTQRNHNKLPLGNPPNSLPRNLPTNSKIFASTTANAQKLYLKEMACTII